MCSNICICTCVKVDINIVVGLIINFLGICMVLRILAIAIYRNEKSGVRHFSNVKFAQNNFSECNTVEKKCRM